MVFKTLGTILGNFVDKSFKSTIKDFKLSGGNIVSTLFKSSDTIALQKFNQELKNGVAWRTAYNNTMVGTSEQAQKNAQQYAILNARLKTYDAQLSANKITQQQYNTRVDATRAKMTALGVETQALTIKEKALTAVTKVMSTAFQLVKMAIVTIAFNVIIAGITKVVNGQTELREKIKQTATEAKQTSTEISNLYTKYLELNQAVVDGTGSKEDLNSATNELLKALGLEGIAVDELTSKYGSLEKAISNVTIESLKSTHDDLVASVDVYKDELLKIGQSIWDGNQFKTANYKIEPNKFDTEIDKIISAFKDIDNLEIFKDVGLSKNDNVTNAVFNLLGDTSTVEGIKQNYETLMEMQDALVSKFGSQKAGELKIYQEINSRLNELKTAYENYTDEVTALNQNAAKTAVLESLKGKELPKTQEEFKQFYNTLISDATTAGTELRNQFVGSEDDIKNSIKSALEGMSIFDEFTAEPIPVEVEVFPTVTTNVSALKQSLNTVKEKIEDTFKNTNIFDEAIQSIQDGKAIDFSDVMSMINLDSSLADKFVKTADGYTIAIKDLTQSRYEYIKSTKDSIQADIDSAKSSISTAEENINTYQKESELLTEAAKHNSDAANRKKELDNAIETERQNIEDANNVIAQNTLLLDECDGVADNFASTVDNVSKKVKLITTAMSDMNENGYISSSTYAELQEMGGNFTECLEVQNGKLILNVKKLKELEAQEYKNKISAKELLLARLQLISESRSASGLDTSFIDEQVSNLQTEIAGYKTIIDEIETAKPNDSDEPKSVQDFKTELARRQHEINMGRMQEDEDYYDWLLSAAHTAYDGLADYQDDLWKHEEEVYKWRQEQEQELFDKKIGNLEKLADKALDNYKERADGNELTVTASFDYARDQINKAITEIQARIDGIRNGTISGNTDDIEALIDDLDSLNDKLIDINKKEIESEKDYISELKDDYSDMMDERIDKVDELSDKIEKSYDKQIDAIDKQIDELEKVKDTEDRIKKIKDAQLAVKEKEQALDEAKREDAKNNYVYFDGTGMSVQASNENQKKAQEELDQSKKDLEEAYRDEQINVLKDQKDILEEQKEAAKDYYDNVKDNLEKQKTQGEKTYEAVEKIYEQLGGDKKQTSSNAELVKKLSKSGDISKAMSELSDSERQKVIDTGVVKVQPNGDYTFDYSAFAKYSSTVDNNTLATQDLTSILKEVVAQADIEAKNKADNSMVAGGFNLVADPKTGKLTKKQVMVNGEVVEGLGHKVYATSKEEWQGHNNSERTSKGSFAGYDTFIDFMRAVSAGKVDISPLTNAFNSGYNPIVDKMNKSVSDTINNVSNSNVNNVNNKPIIQQTIHIDGSADKKTIAEFRNVAATEITNAFNQLNRKLDNIKV
jgi:DNA repair exonuclease SbcCD ATPase subunit